MLTTQHIGHDDLVRFLSEPETYPHTVTRVDRAETHISQVFLTDQHVYKLKKPVHFPFLDYSTLQRRLEACRAEVRLNSRLAPGVYLGVVPISRTRDDTVRLGGRGTVLDYCVMMKRLPADRMLDQLIRRGEAAPRDIERLLDVLLPFYAHAARGPDIDGHATATVIEQNVRDNLTTLETATCGLPDRMFQRVRASQLQFVKLSDGLFRERIEASRICEGHGDLRPEHVCMLDPPVVFDCVEFSLPLRAADVLSELAFLAAECDRLEARRLADAVIQGYRKRSQDNVSECLVDFYKSYRACVRAKVELLRAAQLPAAKARDARKRARQYLQLASFYATEFYHPKLFVMVGAVGTGKSTVANALASELGLEVLRSDLIRRELAGHREPQAGFGEGIYSESMTRRVYEELFQRARALLRGAVSVVLDATFQSPENRRRAAQLAHECGVAIHYLLCRCPDDLARVRIGERLARDANISDARPEFYELQQKELSSLEDLAGSNVTKLDTTLPASGLVLNILERLKRTR